MQVLKCKLVVISIIWLVTSFIVYSIPSKNISTQYIFSDKSLIIEDLKLVTVTNKIQ